MAAVTRVKARPISVPGYEVNDKGKGAAAFTAGDLLIISGTGTNDMPTWALATAGALEAHGIALQDSYAGQEGISVGICGEMAGYSGLTPGQALFPSASVAGGIDTTAPAGPPPARIRARTATSIRYNFV